MSLSSGLNKFYESIAHIGDKHGPQGVLDIQVLYQLENLDATIENLPTAL